MKKIWVRKPISTTASIAASALFVIIALAAWFFATTVRPPAARIPVIDFENKILAKVTEGDKETLLSFYSLDSNKTVYRIKAGLEKNQVIAITDILKKTNSIYSDYNPNPLFSPNVLPNPIDILKSYPGLFMGTNEAGAGFQAEKSLLFAVWVSLRRELIALFFVIVVAIPLGVFMSCKNSLRAFVYPLLVIGSFIPIAALIPLTMAFFGIGEQQKIIFLSLGMFFVMLGLVIKEIDEVDDIYLSTAYTLGMSQLQTIVNVIFPIALPRIWKHFAAVFGLGWGYIIFAEMINTGGSDAINGIGWLFIARQRRFQVDEMYAIFFIIIFFAFLFSWLFKLGARILFKYEKDGK